MVVSRGGVYLARLDPTVGHEIQKTRPCLVVSPDYMNSVIKTAIVAPLTTGGKAYPTRVATRFLDRDGFIALDQVRTIDRQRLVGYLGNISHEDLLQSLTILRLLFDEQNLLA